MGDGESSAREGAPGVHSESMVAFIQNAVAPFVRIAFRPTINGLEHLPERGPYLIVANHSAGVGFAEIASLAVLWTERFGGDRRLAGFAHPLGFRFWPVTVVHRELGSIPSTYEAAYETLELGVPILVFPGGDHETLRPIWQANMIDFGGRRGYLRIARQAQVPIVPMGIRGSHYTAPILFRARLFAWLFLFPRIGLGIKRWGISVLTVAGWIAIAALPLALWIQLLLAWLWAGSPFVLLPWVPWTVQFRIGTPIQPEALFDDDGEESIERAAERVESEVQALVDRGQ